MPTFRVKWEFEGVQEVTVDGDKFDAMDVVIDALEAAFDEAGYESTTGTVGIENERP